MTLIHYAPKNDFAPPRSGLYSYPQSARMRYAGVCRNRRAVSVRRRVNICGHLERWKERIMEEIVGWDEGRIFRRSPVVEVGVGDWG